MNTTKQKNAASSSSSQSVWDWRSSLENSGGRKWGSNSQGMLFWLGWVFWDLGSIRFFVFPERNKTTDDKAISQVRCWWVFGEGCPRALCRLSVGWLSLYSAIRNRDGVEFPDISFVWCSFIRVGKGWKYKKEQGEGWASEGTHVRVNLMLSKFYFKNFKMQFSFRSASAWRHALCLIMLGKDNSSKWSPKYAASFGVVVRNFRKMWSTACRTKGREDRGGVDGRKIEFRICTFASAPFSFCSFRSSLSAKSLKVDLQIWGLFFSCYIGLLLVIAY